ncbi:hypothetical protein SDC9_86872 [bioreactor metagenome]|uniref:Uncharacterized protein n=1 Tax=bioreactor metagenome TaxID=1076179 RepID=A0A644ZH58_9ZZZZ
MNRQACFGINNIAYLVAGFCGTANTMLGRKQRYKICFVVKNVNRAFKSAIHASGIGYQPYPLSGKNM